MSLGLLLWPGPGRPGPGDRRQTGSPVLGTRSWGGRIGLAPWPTSFGSCACCGKLTTSSSPSLCLSLSLTLLQHRAGEVSRKGLQHLSWNVSIYRHMSILSGKLRIFEFYVVFEHISFVFCFSDVFLDFCVFRMCVKYSYYGLYIYAFYKQYDS